MMETLLVLAGLYVLATLAKVGLEVYKEVLKLRLNRPTRPPDLRIVFDGPPGPLAGRFVEVETADGHSVNAGEWVERQDGLWELQLYPPATKGDQ